MMEFGTSTFEDVGDSSPFDMLDSDTCLDQYLNLEGMAEFMDETTLNAQELQVVNNLDSSPFIFNEFAETVPTTFISHASGMVKDEPPSPGQASDSDQGGSSPIHEAYGLVDCFPTTSNFVKQEVLVQPKMKLEQSNFSQVNSQFCNEPTILPSPIQKTVPRRNLKRPRETPIKPTLPKEQFAPIAPGIKKQITVEEERELKKQKRLIKNRESAQKSRQRRKAHIEELESKVATLTSENEALRKENMVIKEDLETLQKVLKTTPNVPSHLLSKQWGKSTPNTGNVKAAGVCLLIVLFSFGLFFNAKSGFNGPSLPFDPSIPREPIPEVIPTGRFNERFSTRVLKSFKDMDIGANENELLEIFPERSRGRHKIERPQVVFEDQQMKQPVVEQVKEEIQTLSSQPILQSSFQPQSQSSASSTDVIRDTPAIRKQKKTSASFTPIVIDLEDEESNTSLISSKNNMTTQSYLFCAEARDVTSPSTTEEFEMATTAGTQRRNLSLLIPLDTFNSTSAARDTRVSEQLKKHNSISSSAPALVEVSCQVLNLNIYPHRSFEDRGVSVS